MPVLRGGNRGRVEMSDSGPLVYVAGSFRHRHAVRMLGRELERLGCILLDWTEKATPPPGLDPVQRRRWMDSDLEQGSVYSFCRDACINADLVIYFGESGQDAGVEVGLAAGNGVPVIGIRGPLESPGLMLHGAVTRWVDSVEEALELLGQLRDNALGDDLAASVRRRWRGRTGGSF